MRKTLVLLLGVAFVAGLPAVASAKRMRHHYRPVVAAPSDDSAGRRFVAATFAQLFVPWEQTFGPRPVEPVRHFRHRRHAG